MTAQRHKLWTIGDVTAPTAYWLVVMLTVFIVAVPVIDDALNEYGRPTS